MSVAERPKLSHAGRRMSTANAELRRPTGVGCSDLLAFQPPLGWGNDSRNKNMRFPCISTTYASCFSGGFRSCWIDNRFHFGNTVRRKASLLRMLAHCRLIWGDIHAIDFVVGHIAFEPLDLRS